MESASSRPVLTSLASIAFSLAVVFLFLAVRGIWPFGGRFLEYMDNGQLVYPTLKYYASALMSGAFDGAFFYDVNGGAGIRVSPTLPHQLLIPSTWIAVAMGDSFLLKDMVWVMLADVACICVTASWFLRRVFPSLPVCWTVLLTAGYAVGGFFQTKYGFMQFLDHAAMFPLFALGLYRLVNGGRGWLYAAGLFLLATSLYSAFMAVVTGWLFAWAFTLPLKGTRERSVRLARSLCADVEFSCEDATRTETDFLLEVCKAAVEAGATTINIPDTVGYATVDEYGGLIDAICREVAGERDIVISTHCHNDLGLATATTLELSLIHI